MRKGAIQDSEKMYRASFGMIRFMHDNALLRALVDPVKLLRELGVRENQAVFEVGAGPGFYTVGASRAVGASGRVWAFEVNPYACAYLEAKLARRGIKNVIVKNINASASGLADSSIDFAFVTGVPYVVGGVDSLLAELARVLKPGGILAYRSRRTSGLSSPEGLEPLGLRFEEIRKQFLIIKKSV